MPINSSGMMRRPARVGESSAGAGGRPLIEVAINHVAAPTSSYRERSIYTIESHTPAVHVCPDQRLHHDHTWTASRRRRRSRAVRCQVHTARSTSSLVASDVIIRELFCVCLVSVIVTFCRRQRRVVARVQFNSHRPTRRN